MALRPARKGGFQAGVRPSKAAAFTLPELLIVLAIVGIVTALCFPALAKMSDVGKKAKCVGNLRQIGAATMAFVGEHNGAYPNFYYDDESGTERTPDAAVGQWYWHLAPYLQYPRWENGGMNLGVKNSPGLPGPCVFLCPATDPEKEDFNPNFLNYPSLRPVSYAPSTRTRSASPSSPSSLGFPTSRVIPGVYAPRAGQIVNPSAKIWLSDSPSPGVLNVTASRWSESYGPAAWPRQAFSRHGGGGNALFFDGHIEWIPLTTFTNPANGNLVLTTRIYFDPTY